MVELLRYHLKTNPTVLAVGHSQGDLEMIQTASIGVFLENSQCAPCADLSLKKIEILENLITVQGLRIFSRMAKVLLLLVYRISILITLKLLYLPFNQLSGTDIAIEYLVLAYTLLLTLPPILCLGATDSGITLRTLQKHPFMYKLGIFNEFLKPSMIYKKALLAVMDGVVVWVFVYWFTPVILCESGHEITYLHLGFFVMGSVTLSTLIEIWRSWGVRGKLILLCGFNTLGLAVFFLLLTNNTSLITDELVGLLAKETLLVAAIQIFGTVGCVTILRMVFRFQGLMCRAKQRWKEDRLDEYSSQLSNIYHSFKEFSAENDDTLDLNPFTLKFKNLLLEQKYAAHYQKVRIPLIKKVFTILSTYTIVSIAIQASSTVNPVKFGIDLSCAAVILLLTIVLFTGIKEHHYQTIILLGMVVFLIDNTVSELSKQSVSYMLAIAVPTLTFIYLDISWIRLACYNFAYFICFLVAVIVSNDESTGRGEFIVVGNLGVSQLGLSLTAAIIGYHLEKGRRIHFALKQSTQLGTERNSAILKSLLPWFVISRVKQGQRSISEEKGVVTVLFCDIVDFDTICAQYTPVELVEFLDSVFLKFDLLCECYGVTKIETVGKTYMACAGIPDAENILDEHLKAYSHGPRAVQMAFAMIQYASTVRLKTGGWLQLKIGINTGPVTAGVVGLHKPQFSLVGDTVNTASRMCSTLDEVNSIQITQSTRMMIPGDIEWTFVERTVEAKGKGLLTTFIVLESRICLLTDQISHLSKDTRLIDDVTVLAVKNKFSEVQVFENPCQKTEFQKDFRAYARRRGAASAYLVQLVSTANYFFLGLLLIFGLSGLDSESIKKLAFRGSKVLSNIIVLVFYKKVKNVRLYTVIVVTLIFGNILFYCIEYELIEEELELFEEISLLLFMIFVCNINLTYTIPLCLLAASLMCIFEFILEAEGNYLFYVEKHVFVFVFLGLQFIGAYMIEKNNVTEFFLQLANNEEGRISQQLLNHMMPKWALNDLQADREISGRINNVTLLFADIVGFTAYSSEHQPNEVIDMLSHLFTQFDELCIKYNSFKLYTIGDCYVVMSCTAKENRDIAQECINIVNLAIELVQIIHQVNKERGSSLNMRIGIHSGDIIEGISGSTIVRYDIYGPDVSVANKMESSGQPGRIKVSDVTMSLLQEYFPGAFKFVYDSVIEIRSVMRAHDSYFLVY